MYGLKNIDIRIKDQQSNFIMVKKQLFKNTKYQSLLRLTSKNDKTNLEKSINLYNKLKDKNIDTIIDDTDENFSSKMKKFNLIGVPYQILLGKKSDDEMLEFKKVGEESTKLKLDEIIKIITSKKKN